MHATRQVGFTLIELMVVVAVIAIIAAIAVPQYAEQVRKGKRAEAVQSLGDLQLRQEGWRAEHPTYGSLTELFGTAANATAYNNSLKNFTVTVSNNTATTFTLTATRKNDLASDPKCGNFILELAVVPPATLPTLQKNVSSGDANYCWRR
jgi:type IV pilus assembly protein PilE